MVLAERQTIVGFVRAAWPCNGHYMSAFDEVEAKSTDRASIPISRSNAVAEVPGTKREFQRSLDGLANVFSCVRRRRARALGWRCPLTGQFWALMQFPNIEAVRSQELGAECDHHVTTGSRSSSESMFGSTVHDLLSYLKGGRVRVAMIVDGGIPSNKHAMPLAPADDDQDFSCTRCGQVGGQLDPELIRRTYGATTVRGVPCVDPNECWFSEATPSDRVSKGLRCLRRQRRYWKT